MLYQEEAERLAWLRQAYQEGLDSGPAAPLDVTTLKAEARRRLAAMKV